MKYKKIIVLTLILCVSMIFQNVFSFAYYIGEDTEYVWSETTVQTSSDSGGNGDFLDLSCESAILIEQTTRRDFI